MIYNVKVYQCWREEGTVDIEADSQEEAWELAEQAVNSSSLEICWDSDNMSPEDSGVDE